MNKAFYKAMLMASLFEVMTEREQPKYRGWETNDPSVKDRTETCRNSECEKRAQVNHLYCSKECYLESKKA